MEKTFTFDMASKAYADYILNSKDRYAPLIVEIPEGIEDIEPLAFNMMPLTSVKFHIIRVALKFKHRRAV